VRRVRQMLRCVPCGARAVDIVKELNRLGVAEPVSEKTGMIYQTCYQGGHYGWERQESADHR